MLHDSIVFLAGAMTGATLGVFMISAAAVAKSADEQAEREFEKFGYDKLVPPCGGVREQQKERQHDR